jgi:hypothetical protein
MAKQRDLCVAQQFPTTENLLSTEGAAGNRFPTDGEATPQMDFFSSLLAATVRGWFGPVLAVGDDHLIQDVTAIQAVPRHEIDLPGVVEKILIPLRNHQSFAS